MPRAVLPILSLTLAACASSATELALSIGPTGASGSFDPGNGQLTLDLTDTTCTARLSPTASASPAAPLLSGTLTCRDGRKGTVQLARRHAPTATYSGPVQIGSMTTRVIYGPPPPQVQDPL